MPSSTCWITRKTTPATALSARFSSSFLRRGPQLELEHPHRVAEVDAPQVVLRQLQAVDRLDRFLDEERPALRVERAVGAEQDLPAAEEIQAGADAARPAVDRRVVVEHLEVVDRALLHVLAQPLVV